MLLQHILPVIRNLGVKEDAPKSKKHLNYENLSLKSKRILNRLFNLVDSLNLSIDEYLKELILQQTVKTKT